MKTSSNVNADGWGPRSLSWRLAAATGAVLVGLGVEGLALPPVGLAGFGMAMRDPADVPVWRPKAVRDLATGIIPLVLLALNERRALGGYMLSASLIPAADAVIVATTGSRKPWQVVMHGGTAVFGAALGAALLRHRH